MASRDGNRQTIHLSFGSDCPNISGRLFEAFWAQGSFIENLGRPVVDACAQMKFEDKSEEHHFNKALSLFWPRFEERLRSLRVQTFNKAFIEIARDEKKLSMLSESKLEPLVNTLIDELQDISPQIVAWLLACHRRLRAEWEHPTTIMGVGDDWQSIYGWRGSAPEFFIRFHDHFKSHPDTPGKRMPLPMSTNFRSVEPIVVKATRMLERIENKVDKKTVAHKKADTEGIELHLEAPSDVVERAKFIKEKLQAARNSGSREKLKVIVVSRSRDTRDDYERALKAEGPDIDFFTFHGAKGLQGEIAIVLEDAAYDETYVFRNAVYAAMGKTMFTQTYDEAQTDEAYRLAYVALTRGVSEVHWFVDEPRQAARAFQDAEQEIVW
jgi:superfamily I DNA/RNA helicase